MLGYLELLETIKTTKEAQRYIGIVKNRAEILTQLTEELFDYSTVITKDQAIEAQPVNVKSVLEESLSAFYLALQEQKITPNIQMPKQDVIRTLDPVALLRVFSNLLSNVIKYSDGDLEITLSKEGEIWIWVNTSDTICENFFEIPAGEYLIVSTSRQTKTVWPLIEAMKLKPCGNLAKKM